MSGIEDMIKEEIAANKILIYGKGTKAAPQCGFTSETIQFFNKFVHTLLEIEKYTYKYLRAQDRLPG